MKGQHMQDRSDTMRFEKEGCESMRHSVRGVSNLGRVLPMDFDDIPHSFWVCIEEVVQSQVVCELRSMP